MIEISYPHYINFFRLAKAMKGQVVFSSQSDLMPHAGDICMGEKETNQVEVICHFMGLCGIHGALPYQYLLLLCKNHPVKYLIKIFENHFYHFFYDMCNPFHLLKNKKVSPVKNKHLTTWYELHQIVQNFFPNIDYAINQNQYYWLKINKPKKKKCLGYLSNDLLIGQRLLSTGLYQIVFNGKTLYQTSIIHKHWPDFLIAAKNFSIKLVKTIKLCHTSPQYLGEFPLGCYVFSSD